MNVCRRKAAGGGQTEHRPGLAPIVVLASMAFGAAFASRASATPTQQDVFKSIQESVGESKDTDWTPMILLFTGGAAILLLLALVNRRSKQVSAAPRTLNNPSKLMKELLGELPLKKSELRQLKLLAEAVTAGGGERPDPLALLLCPSLIVKGLQAGAPKVDRKQIAQVVRKLRAGGGAPNVAQPPRP